MAACAGGFVTAPTYTVGSYPSSVAVSDFNGDGIADLAVANTDDSTVSILLGNGDGTFQPALSYAVGSNPASVAVADLNGDGHFDLAVSSSAGTVTILLGNGDGTFQAAQSYPAGDSPQSVAVGDFNGDGYLDLAVANGIFVAGTVSILLGNGDGTFQAPQAYAAGANPACVTVADFNGDGHLDLAVANNVSPATLCVLLGNGDGTFGSAQNYPAASLSESVAVGDFNGDGIPDLVVVSYSYGQFLGSARIFLGNGDGTFSHTGTLPAAGRSVAIGDINGDGHLDLAVAGDSGVSIWLGNGDGTFQAGPNYAAGSEPQAVAMSDFNSDGHLDLAVVNANFPSAGTVSVLLGKGDGTFQAAPSYLVGLYPLSVAVADFNSDGIADLVLANQGVAPNSGTVSVLLGNGDGTFHLAATFADGSGPRSVAVGDFNGDGKPDIVTTNFYQQAIRSGGRIIESDVRVLLGNGDGTFQHAEPFAAASGPWAVAVGDFNGDSLADLAVANQGGISDQGAGVSILLGNGDGTFQAAQNYPAGARPVSLAVGDFNGDGRLDLAVGDSDANAVRILLGNGDGTFQAAQSYALGGYPSSLVVADLNRDGAADLAVTNEDGGTLNILLGNGDGTFQAPQGYAVGLSPACVASGDYNHDGIVDLTVANFDDGTVSILLGNGDGTFRPPVNYAAGVWIQSLAVGDFNGDGLPDLAVANAVTPGAVTVLLNAGGW
jgi:hypothetical protein